MGELEHIAAWIAQGTSQKSEEASITRIQFKQCCKSADIKAAATIYYKTLSGKQGHFETETKGISMYRGTARNPSIQGYFQAGCYKLSGTTSAKRF